MKEEKRWKCPTCDFKSKTKGGVNRHRSWKVGDGKHEDPGTSDKDPVRLRK